MLIGSVDPNLDTDDITTDLEQQADSARFRGIRVLSGLEPESPATSTILAWLERRGYVFDLVTRPETMQRWLDVLTDYPHLPVALEHTGWPSTTDKAGFDAWYTAIRACARRPGIVCKVTGLGMATADLSVDTLRPWVETARARGQGRSHAVEFARRGASIVATDICDDITTVPYPLACLGRVSSSAVLMIG